MSASSYSAAENNFKVIKVLGEGSYGQVNLVSWQGEQELMAVKVMAHHNEENKKIVETMKMETLTHKKASEVKHANILQLLKTGKDRTNFYLLLEYAAGGSIMDKIEEGVGMPVEKAQNYFKQLIEGLGYIHGLGIVHRDVKPENLLLTSEGVLKIADFGLAAIYIFHGEEQLVDGVCGTVRCMAPEVLADDSYSGEPVDVWSAGITLIEMLTGDNPWEVATDESEEYQEYVDKKKKCLDEEPWASIEVNILGLLWKMLNVDPIERATFKEIKEHPWYSHQYAKSRKRKIGKTMNF